MQGGSSSSRKAVPWCCKEHPGRCGIGKAQIVPSALQSLFPVLGVSFVPRARPHAQHSLSLTSVV